MTDSIRMIAVTQSIIDSSANALDLVKEALCAYTDLTGIAWELDTIIYPDNLVPDSTNIIRFVGNNHPTIMNVPTATAATASALDNCVDLTSLYEVRASGRFSINLRADLKSMPGATADNWYFSSTGSVGNREMDFYSIIIHELGHAHGYKHVNDTTDIMYYLLDGGDQRRDLNLNNIDCGEDILKAGIEEIGSQLNSNCALPIKITDICLTTSTKEPTDIIDRVLLYPNPTNDKFTLLIEGYKGGEAIINIYNSLGQLVQTKPLRRSSNKNFKVDISIANEASGISFVTLKQDQIYSLGTIQKI